MRVSSVYSVSRVNFNRSGLSQNAVRKLDVTQKTISPGTSIQDTLDIKEIRDHPKIEPIHELVPLYSPFDQEDSEEEKDNQETPCFYGGEMMQYFPNKQSLSEDVSDNGDNPYSNAMKKAKSAYSMVSSKRKPGIPSVRNERL